MLRVTTMLIYKLARIVHHCSCNTCAHLLVGELTGPMLAPPFSGERLPLGPAGGQPSSSDRSSRL